MIDTKEYDVAVVGGGLAGLTAGWRAAQLGCRVIVVEQGADELYACNSRYAGGWFHLAFQDPTGDADALVDTLLGLAPADVNHPLIESIALNAGRTLAWLSEYGRARFIRGGPLGWHKNLLSPPRPPRSRLVWPGCGPDLLVRELGAGLSAAGGLLARGHCVERIGREGQSFVVGCRTTTGETQLTARALIMADGGFAANLLQLNEHISRHAEKILQRNAGTAQGAGISLAPGLGAALTETKSFYGHLHSSDAIDDPGLWPYPTIDYLALAGIVVNRAGDRFIDDGRDGVFVTNALAAVENPQDAFAVFDGAIWESEGREVRAPCNPLLKQLGGTMFTAPNLVELASRAGIDRERLVRTVAEYNGAVRSGNMETLSVPKSPAKIRAREISRAPFFAIPICPGITHTMGGIAINPFGAVESVDGGAIPGLFAAGSTVGGAEGGRDSFYLGGLCKAATLGLMSGEGAAQFITTGLNR